MCWTSKNKPVQYTAESRIPVYKIMVVSGDFNKILKSYYRGAIYDLNTNHVNDLATPKECIDGFTLKPEYRIDIGLHSYSTSNTVCLRKYSYLTVKSKKTREELDCYQMPFDRRVLQPPFDRILQITHLAKVSGYIPVNAKYYVNEHGEYVSNEIVLTDLEEYIRA